MSEPLAFACDELRARAALVDLPACCPACHEGPPPGFEVLAQLASPIGGELVRVYGLGAELRVCCTVAEHLCKRSMAVPA